MNWRTAKRSCRDVAGRSDIGAGHSASGASSGLRQIGVLAGLALLVIGLPWTMATVSADSSEGKAGAPRAASSRLATGAAHSCAINPVGTVYCWGRNGRGALGLGTTAPIGDDDTPADGGPVNLGVGRTARAIAAGSNHTCALLDNATINCWGRNDFGQLGRGNALDIGDDETPAQAGPIALGAGRTALAVAAGAAHTCAILDTGAVSCWGANELGQLGQGNLAALGDDETPADVAPLNLGAGRTATAITAGSGHTCAILDNGSVLCWGYAASGQLGLGSLPPPFTDGGGGGGGGGGLPVDPNCYDLVFIGADCPRPGTGGGGGGGGTGTGLMAIGDDEVPGASAAVNLGAGRTAVAISSGASHTCALLDDGSVRCWGQNRTGELGKPGQAGNVGDDEVPGAIAAVNLGDGRSAVAVSAGYAHSCAVLDNGALVCWGAGGVGQLGHASTAALGDNEEAISAGPIGLGAGRTARAVSAGGYLRVGTSTSIPSGHTCVLLDNETVRCFGGNETGQLGLATSLDLGDDELPTAADVVNIPGMAGDAQIPGTFVGQAPLRLVDTRLGTGAPLAKLGAAGVLPVTVASSADVVAVALNVTVVQPESQTFVSVYPTGTSRPTVSNINAGPNSIVANLVVVKVGTDGKVDLYNHAGLTDIVVDKLGEFRTTGGAAFVPQAPIRVLDTREGVGAPNAAVGQDATIDVQLTGAANIPAGVDSVVLNVTADAPTQGTFVTVFPTGEPRPLASNLNPAAGQTVPNLVIAKIGAGGKVSMYNRWGSVELIVDVMGWYGPPAPGSEFVPVTPNRLADTRAGQADAVTVTESCSGVPPVNCTVKLQLAGAAGIPADATAVALNVGVEAGSFGGYVSAGTAPTPAPATSNVNFAPFLTVANAVVVKIAADGAVYLNVPQGPVPLFVDLQGFYRTVPGTG